MRYRLKVKANVVCACFHSVEILCFMLAGNITPAVLTFGLIESIPYYQVLQQNKLAQTDDIRTNIAFYYSMFWWSSLLLIGGTFFGILHII